MLTIIWELIQPFIGYIGLGLTALLALWGKGKWDRHKGAQGQRAKQAEAALEATVKGNAAARKGKTEAAEQLRQGKTPEEIVKGNDNAWR